MKSPIVLIVLHILNVSCQGQDYASRELKFTGFPSKQHELSFYDTEEDQVDEQYPVLHHQNNLQTYDLPLHPLQNGLQYKLSDSQKFSNHDSQSSNFNSEPLRDYIKPSTHRPNYSPLLSRENLENSLQINRIYRQNPTESTLEDYEYEEEIEPTTIESQMRGKSKQEKNELIGLKENDPTVPYSGSLENLKDNSSNMKSQNDIDDEDYDEEYADYEEDEDDKENTEYDDEEQDEAEEKHKPFDVLASRPMNISHEKSFIDSTDRDFMDSTTQDASSSNIITQSPILPATNISNSNTEVPPQETIQSSLGNLEINSEKKEFPELVVSVVTSKTIVNNTITFPAVPPQTVTSSLKESDFDKETSTDSWVVVASVQTSKSISGTKYIPPSVVEKPNESNDFFKPNDTNEQQKTEQENESWNVESNPQMISSSMKASTESLTDKLDRVQSDLSSGLLTGGFKNDRIEIIEENTSVKMNTISELTTNSTPFSETSTSTKAPYPQVRIRKFDAVNRPLRPKTKEAIKSNNRPTLTTSKPSSKTGISKQEEVIQDPSKALEKIKLVNDINAFLPAGYKSSQSQENNISAMNSRITEGISTLLESGHTSPIPTSTQRSSEASSFSPSVTKTSTPGKNINNILAKTIQVADISNLLPPGFKLTENESISASDSAQSAKPEKGTFGKEKLPRENNPTNSKSKLLSDAKPITDISSLLPKGYKPPKNILDIAKPVENINSLLPPGYKIGEVKENISTSTSSTKETERSETTPSLPINTSTPGTIKSTTQKSKEVKLIFPSRPGQGERKSHRSTTVKPLVSEKATKKNVPTISIGWPVRASTEFTGWPTPSTTPISIEKLLESARIAFTSTSTVEPTTATSTTSTTTPTTTTQKATTPGTCVEECDLAGTIKLVGGAKWVPELLDRHTKEWQILANDVQNELESIYRSSPVLNKWYRKIRIDGFSEGSVLVDYLVELSEIGREIDTQEIKSLFLESLTDAMKHNQKREGKSLNETKLVSLSSFEVDPKFTDFIVIPKNPIPTTGYKEDNFNLPQWAIAVVVIGLASLLFVVIFGVTVLFNRHKNSKKNPTPLTEDMLNELQKNHMGGLENYGADEFYNMEDVWNESLYEQKMPKTRSRDSNYDSSISNIYDSWQSTRNGPYDRRPDAKLYTSPIEYNTGSRRPKYDLDF